MANTGILKRRRKVKSSKWVHDEIKRQLVDNFPGVTNRFDDNYGIHIHMADTEYCLPPENLAKKIIKRSKVDQRAWDKDGAFDCDDFALVLKADFAHEAYRRGGRGAYCFGIVWGMLPYPRPHALNWMINSDGVFRFVEPQEEKIEDAIIELTPDKVDKYLYIHLMLV